MPLSEPIVSTTNPAIWTARRLAMRPDMLEGMVLARHRGEREAARPENERPPLVACCGHYDMPPDLFERSRYLTLQGEGVALWRISGVLTEEPEWTYWGWSADYGSIVDVLAQVLADMRVERVVVKLESGGGMVPGLFNAMQMAQKIVASSGKRVDVYSEVQCLSAASILASALVGNGGELVSGPHAEQGMQGLYRRAVFIKSMLEKYGEDVRYYFAGDHKVDLFAELEPTPEAEAYVQGQIDRIYGEICDAVGANRAAAWGVDPAAASALVRAQQSRIYTGQAAVDAGVVDRIAFLDEILTAPAATVPAAGDDPTAQSMEPIRAQVQETDMLTLKTLAAKLGVAEAGIEAELEALLANRTQSTQLMTDLTEAKGQVTALSAQIEAANASLKAMEETDTMSAAKYKENDMVKITAGEHAGMDCKVTKALGQMECYDAECLSGEMAGQIIRCCEDQMEAAAPEESAAVVALKAKVAELERRDAEREATLKAEREAAQTARRGAIEASIKAVPSVTIDAATLALLADKGMGDGFAGKTPDEVVTALKADHPLVFAAKATTGPRVITQNTPPLTLRRAESVPVNASRSYGPTRA